MRSACRLTKRIVGALQDSSKDNVELGNKTLAKAFESYPPPKNTP